MAHVAHRQPQHRTSSSRAGLTNNVDLRQQQRGKRGAPNDQETIAYIKRVLCQKSRTPDSTAESPTRDLLSSEPLDALLPPLTSSNAVDIQLYAFIAVILNLFVQAWYNRITSDQQFVDEIVQIIAHCTRGLEQRLRHVDLESLLLDELPDLLTEHVNGRLFHSRRTSMCHADLMYSSQDISDCTNEGNAYSGREAPEIPRTPSSYGSRTCAAVC